MIAEESAPPGERAVVDGTPPVTELPEGEIPSGGPGHAVLAGVVPVLLGLVTMWLARDLGLGTLTDPGPGLWPMIVAVLVLLTGVGILLRARQATDTEAFTRGAVVVVIAAASLALYAFLFELVGFEIPTVLLLVLWLKFFGNENWRTTAVVSVVATAAAYALFITALGVPLPHLIAI
ncbi:tripartite tricarboxylate transporter TctB family protein [Micromonospora sp. ATA32]|nr:tripartite tricarboxylate transporter TctB family protein [Micromonospora sp. ATA32]